MKNTEMKIIRNNKILIELSDQEKSKLIEAGFCFGLLHNQLAGYRDVLLVGVDKCIADYGIKQKEGWE